MRGTMDLTETSRSTRTYPVPARVLSTVSARMTSDPVYDSACASAFTGRVKGYHLPVLASGPWYEGAQWAQSVLDRESASLETKKNSLLASIGWDSGSEFAYHGVLDSNVEDHEIIVGLIRSVPSSADRDLEYWDGLDWGQVQLDEDDNVDFVLLDPDLLATVVDSFNLGIGGVALSPFRPKAWTSGEDCNPVLDFFDRIVQGPAEDNGVQVYSYSGDVNQLIASLGTTDQVAYESVQRAVSKWVRRLDPMCASGSESVLKSLLAREGLRSDQFSFEQTPEHLTKISVRYGPDTQTYVAGESVMASGGVGPDIVYAVVDEMDTSAVLDLIRVSPGPIVYKRQGGSWVKDQPTLIKLLGVNPPHVIELHPEQVPDVISQVDAFDKAHPQKDPLVSAGWAEDLHPRDGGKFAPKEKQTGIFSKPSSAVKHQSPPPAQAKVPHNPFVPTKHTPVQSKSGLPTRDTGFDPSAGQRDGIVLNALDDADSFLAKDHQFDLQFAQEGMGEARRREIFDRQLEGFKQRLIRSGVSSRGLAATIERKIQAEKTRRDHFEKSRKNKAEQERIRRMKSKGPDWSKINIPAPMVSDASHMPRKLKDYWVAGKGAAKIRWGSSGDFNRCRRALSKYLPPEKVSGACASLHHVATGTWPGKGRHH